jgi:putative membrane-bound dehydrogenase-like protein
MKAVLLFIPSVLLFLGLPHSSADIEKAADAPQPLSPGESAKRIRLPKGFRIELVASEPVVTEPSGIAIDEHGRLFICELHGYNIEGHLDTEALNKTGKLDTQVRRIRWEFLGGEVAEEAEKHQFGKLKLLIDTDGDGIMDQAKVWADDIPPCYGIVPAEGGIIVACAPHIMFYADRDGDGVPEVRETLFTGFEVDTIERGINNPIWSVDNWIYVGSSGGGGTITGPHLKNPVKLGSSDFRIKADGTAIEPVNGSVGTFGMTMNQVGDRFPSSGGGPANYALPLPYRYLARNPHVPTPRTTHGAANYNRGFRISDPHPWRVKRRKDPAWIKFYGDRETNSNYFSGGCSTTFYDGALFPEQYHGNLFYCEPSLNIIHRTILTRDGSGYIARRAPGEEASEFLASTDQWFRPMNLRIGPDGALYIVDMYREIIEDYSAIPRFLQQQYGLDKGAGYGRIWRLFAEDSKPEKLPDFSALSTAALATALNDPNPWRRSTAQRLLVEQKDQTALGVLGKQGTIRGLHALDGIGALEPKHLRVPLAHTSYGVRLHALRLASRWLESDKALRAQVLSMVDDPDPSVRLQVAMALGDSTDQTAADRLLTLVKDHGGERWMDAAILSSVNNANGGRLLTALLSEAAVSPGVLAMLTPLASTVASRRESNHLRDALERTAPLGHAIQRAVLTGIVEGLSRGTKPLANPDGGWTPVVLLLKSENPEIRRLATQLGSQVPLGNGAQLSQVYAAAATTALSDTLDLETRQQAIQLLAIAPYEILSPIAASLLHPKQSPMIHEAAIAALGASSDRRSGAALVSAWPSLSPKSRHAALSTIFARQNRLPALINAVENNTVHRGDLSNVQREQLTSIEDPELLARTTKLFSNDNTDQHLPERIASYQKALTGNRDAAAGKSVYENNCIVCHKLDEQGNDVGPSLASTSGKPDEAILLDILDPNGKIEPEFKLYLVSTESGDSYAGVLASESPTSLTLKHADGGTDIVLRKDIVTMMASDLSLMPANLYTQITPEDAANLIAFLRTAFRAEEK